MSSLSAFVSLTRRYQENNKIGVTVVDLPKSQSARAARARATFVDAPPACPPPAALSAARSCTRAVGNAGVSVRNGRARVWFTLLACSLVLLNPLRSAGFQLGLATMSDEALVTRQQRMVRWPAAAPSVGFSTFPLSVGREGVLGGFDFSLLFPLGRACRVAEGVVVVAECWVRGSPVARARCRHLALVSAWCARP